MGSTIGPGTTPRHTFSLPVGEASISALAITYQQDGYNLFTKTLEDCTFDGTNVSVCLTQEDTLQFSNNQPVLIQVRLRDKNNMTYNSNVIETTTDVVLLAEVI